MRTFDSGATRDDDTDKYDYEGFLSPVVLERYAAYMHENRVQADGEIRASDNWQKGIAKRVYMKSLLRHMMDLWAHHRFPYEDSPSTRKAVEDCLCGVLFNTMGYLFERLIREETP